MPIVIACPTCQARIRAPETVVGRQVTCPQCRTPFAAAAATDPTPLAPAVKSVGAEEDWPLPSEGAGSSSMKLSAAADATRIDEEAVPTLTPVLSGSATRAALAPTPTPSRPRARAVDYLLFRRMLAPAILLAVHYLGVLFILMGGCFNLAVLVVLPLMGPRDGTGPGVVFMALMVLVVAVGTVMTLVFWRVLCEVVVTFFRIFETLEEIRRQDAERF